MRRRTVPPPHSLANAPSRPKLSTHQYPTHETHHSLVSTARYARAALRRGSLRWRCCGWRLLGRPWCRLSPYHAAQHPRDGRKPLSSFCLRRSGLMRACALARARASGWRSSWTSGCMLSIDHRCCSVWVQPTQTGAESAYLLVAMPRTGTRRHASSRPRGARSRRRSAGPGGRPRRVRRASSPFRHPP